MGTPLPDLKAMSLMSYVLVRLTWLHTFQEFCLFVIDTGRSFFLRPAYRRDIFRQMDYIGVGSLMICALTGLFTGMVLALQTSIQLATFGAGHYLGRAVMATMVRELGPVLTAIMVAGRSGAGVASELGSMQVTGQIDALRIEGSDPLVKLVRPRVLALMISLPLLTIFCNYVALLGGALIAKAYLQLPLSFYWASAYDTLKFVDLTTGLFKPAVFGALIGLIACFYGTRHHIGTVEIGLSTTRTVVVSSIMVLVSDFFITKFFVGIGVLR